MCNILKDFQTIFDEESTKQGCYLLMEVRNESVYFYINVFYYFPLKDFIYFLTIEERVYTVRPHSSCSDTDNLTFFKLLLKCVFFLSIRPTSAAP